MGWGRGGEGRGRRWAGRGGGRWAGRGGGEVGREGRGEVRQGGEGGGGAGRGGGGAGREGGGAGRGGRKYWTDFELRVHVCKIAIVLEGTR